MFLLKKNLNRTAQLPCSASLQRQAYRKRAVRRRGEEVFCLSNVSRLISKLARNYVDEAFKKILAGPLSLMGRLFEIYFVRLIGTPNQNSKNDVSSG